MNNLDSDDGLLVERSQMGDRRAFDQLLGKHQHCAYRYALRLTHDSEEAGDVVAETAIRMFKGIASFRGSSSFTTWMYRITTNCFLDRNRKKDLVVNFGATSNIDGGNVSDQIADKSPSAYELLANSEDMDAVVTAVGRLRVWQQAILTMRYSEMRSYEEIAVTLAVPIGTVKSRISRARCSLRSIIDDQQAPLVRRSRRILEA